MCCTLNQPQGPVCIENAEPPVPPELRTALEEYETAAVNFASRFIPDHALRLKYIEDIKKMSESILEDFRNGEITAENGARLANQLRNEILETTRGASSDVGRAWAEKLKAEGKTLVELQEKYAQKIFQREFEALTEAERNEVFLAVIEASGRARPSIVATSARLAKFSKGLLFLTAAVAVYQIATSDRPGREAVKQGVVIGSGMAGAAAIGAIAGTALLCGPGAPICVGILVFVGGGAVAFGADAAFDHWWK
jgi:hypothetical protein